MTRIAYGKRVVGKQLTYFHWVPQFWLISLHQSYLVLEFNQINNLFSYTIRIRDKLAGIGLPCRLRM